jgi:hypothetical protein
MIGMASWRVAADLAATRRLREIEVESGVHVQPGSPQLLCPVGVLRLLVLTSHPGGYAALVCADESVGSQPPPVFHDFDPTVEIDLDRTSVILEG